MRCWVHLCLLVGSGGLIAAEPEPLPRDRPLNILIVGNSFVNLLADQVDLAALAAGAGSRGTA